MARTVSRADDRIVTTRGVPPELPWELAQELSEPAGQRSEQVSGPLRDGRRRAPETLARQRTVRPRSRTAWLGGDGRQRPHLRRVTRLGPGCSRNARIRAGDTAGELLLAAQRVGDFAEQLGELDVEGRADRRQQLRRRFLLPALNLRQISKADTRTRGHLAQRPALAQPQPAQRLADHLA